MNRRLFQLNLLLLTGFVFVSLLSALTAANTVPATHAGLHISPIGLSQNLAGRGESKGAFELGWSNPDDIIADDNTDADVTCFDFDETVKRLISSRYGFMIPSGATINGIEVQIEIHDDSSSGGVDVTDVEARLAKAGVPIGNDKSKAGAWPSTRTLRSYGGSADLWGTTWTPAEINADGFGFSLRPGTSGACDNSKVDYHGIIVYYTP